MHVMRIRHILLASVCSVFLAASAAVSGVAAASPENRLVSEAYEALQSGDATFAVSAYSKAIESRELEPEILANALLNRGLAYQRMNEHQFAIDDYTAALRIDAMSGGLRALALYNRGLSYQRLEKDAMAMEDFTSALFFDGQFSHAYYSRGTLLHESGQYLFALADYDKALRFGYPDAPRLHLAQAMTYEKLGRTADARGALQKSLAANPGYEPARKRLALLDGQASPAVPDGAGDQLQTAAVTPANEDLPAATAPSEELLGEADAGSAPSGKIMDRIPAETAEAVAAEPAAQQPEAAPAEERILAVEDVPEEPQVVAAAVQEPDAESAPAADAPPASGWSVQLASATTEEAAWAAWNKMKARSKALAGKEPVVVRADLGTKGIFYRVRLVGFETQSEAGSECSRLKARGIKCFISKSSG